jgi:phosphoglycerate kinase
MAILSVKDCDVAGKRVFCRVDFNTPLDERGVVRDDTRIRRALPTINHLTGAGARVILASHLGRPKGEKKPSMSLRPVANALSALLGKTVKFSDDCVGPVALEAVNGLAPGEVLLLENLRFHAGETKNDDAFARELAQLADVYVNDAFGTAHRAHASTVGVARLVPVRAAGLLMKEELESLEKAFAAPRRPVVAIFGGAKVSDKLGVLRHLLGIMDAILIGGGMANTFLAAQGYALGRSLVEEALIPEAAGILEKARETGRPVLLPEDLVTADKMEAGASSSVERADAASPDRMALDIGPMTVERFCAEIARAGTVVWNGPMGVFETPDFSEGTRRVARAVADSKCFSVVGGGDTVRAVEQFEVADKMSYISTGGGAFMEFLEGKTLPGVAALEA